MKVRGYLLDIGVHSIRKGASTYAVNGIVGVSASISVIFLRACWTQGAIKDTYLKYEGAADTCLGRILCGLPLTGARAVKFSTLPPVWGRNMTNERVFGKTDTHTHTHTLTHSLTHSHTHTPEQFWFCLISCLTHTHSTHVDTFTLPLSHTRAQQKKKKWKMLSMCAYQHSRSEFWHGQSRSWKTRGLQRTTVPCSRWDRCYRQNVNKPPQCAPPLPAACRRETTADGDTTRKQKSWSTHLKDVQKWPQQGGYGGRGALAKHVLEVGWTLTTAIRLKLNKITKACAWNARTTRMSQTQHVHTNHRQSVAQTDFWWNIVDRVLLSQQT
jgi:hypothetical protein